MYPTLDCIALQVEKMDECTGAWLPAGNPKGTSWELRNLVEGRSYIKL